MGNVRANRWARMPLVFACTAAGMLLAGQACAQTDSSAGGSSFGQSITNSFQSISKPANQPASPPEDPISLKVPGKAGVELYVAVAHLYVETGKYAEAEEQYQQALKKAPNDIRVLLGYAMLKDQIHQPDEALKLYQRAERKHPAQPALFNNLAVHFVRVGMVHEAIAASQRAVELKPREPRYRNNLAALYVEAEMPQEAFKQLREVYDESVAHYNLGFLLNKRGMKQAALQEFTIALRTSPGMMVARQWVERLTRESDASHTALGAAAPQGPALQAGPMPPQYQGPAVYAPPRTAPRMENSAAPNMPSAPLAPLPPQFGGPPVYHTPPPSAPVQYMAQGPQTPAMQNPQQWQYPPQGPPPMQGPNSAAAQNPAVVQYAAPPQNRPQPPVLQYQDPVAMPAAGPAPIVAMRETQPTQVRIVTPPASTENALRRLPPTSDPRYMAQPGRDGAAPN